VIVDVRHLVVLAPLGLLVTVLVRVDEPAVVVFVAVVMRPVLEGAEHLTALVMVRDVVVVVGMSHGRMMVLVLLISNDCLLGSLHVGPPCSLHLTAVHAACRVTAGRVCI
jgi:hypothetical protein